MIKIDKTKCAIAKRKKKKWEKESKLRKKKAKEVKKYTQALREVKTVCFNIPRKMTWT